MFWTFKSTIQYKHEYRISMDQYSGLVWVFLQLSALRFWRVTKIRYIESYPETGRKLINSDYSRYQQHYKVLQPTSLYETITFQEKVSTYPKRKYRLYNRCMPSAYGLFRCLKFGVIKM